MAIPAIIGVAARSVGTGVATGARFAGKAAWSGLKAGVANTARGAIAAQRNTALNKAVGVYDTIQAAREKKRQDNEEKSKPAKSSNQEKAERDERENKQRQEKAHDDAMEGKTNEQTGVLKVISKDTKDILAGIELLVEEGMGTKEKQGGGLLSGIMALLGGLSVFSKGFLPTFGAFLAKSATKLGSTVAAMISRAMTGVLGTLARAGSGVARAAGTVGKAALTAGGALATRAGLAAKGVAKAGPAAARAAGTTGSMVAKAAGKSALKKIPLIGAGVGLALAANRAMAGDWVGAGMEATSGALSIVPGLGTAASLGMDAAILARDVKRGGSKPDFSNVTGGASTVQGLQKESPSQTPTRRIETLLESLIWTTRTMISNQISPNKGIYIRPADDAFLNLEGKPTPLIPVSSSPSAPAARRARGTPPTASTSTASLEPIPAHGGLGALSAYYESGRRGSSAVGFDSTGGTSYGKYQIASRTGTMDQFMRFLKTKDPEVFERLQAAGPADSGRNGNFANVWRQLAGEGKLNNYEHDFIKQSHYDPGLRAINSDSLRGMIGKSAALQDVLWSTAVQHGGTAGGRLFNKVYREGMSEEELINAIYSERGTRFRSSTPEVRASVLNRFQNESKNALSMVGRRSDSPIASQVRESVVNSSAAAKAPIIVSAPTVVQQSQKAPGSGGSGASRTPMSIRNPDSPIYIMSLATMGST